MALSAASVEKRIETLTEAVRAGTQTVETHTDRLERAQRKLESDRADLAFWKGHPLAPKTVQAVPDEENVA